MRHILGTIMALSALPATLASAESATLGVNGGCFCNNTDYTFKLTFAGNGSVFATVDCPPSTFGATWTPAGASGTNTLEADFGGMSCFPPGQEELPWYRPACDLTNGIDESIVFEAEVNGSLCFIITVSESEIGLPLSGIRITSITMSGNSDGAFWATDWIINYEIDGGPCQTDACAICAGTITDCDRNGIDDGCDIASDPGSDANGNGVLDACEVMAGDLDGDGDVDTTDLLALLAQWGRCDAPCPPACAADFDGDCQVGTTDLLTLLAGWG